MCVRACVRVCTLHAHDSAVISMATGACTEVPNGM